MKKALCLFLALLLPLTLCGCGEKPGEPGASSLIAELDAHKTDREDATPCPWAAGRRALSSPALISGTWAT